MTRRLAGDIARALNECSPDEIGVECYDLRDGSEEPIVMSDETIAVVGMPVHVGKIPLPGADAMKRISGKSAMTIAAVTYGGRSYGNALFELQHILEDCGQKVIGAGAFMVSYQALRGSQRSAAPAMDTAALTEFGKAASAKIQRLGGCEIEGLRIKPMPVELRGRMPVHKVSRISPKAAAAAQAVLEMLSRRKRNSEWFL